MFINVWEILDIIAVISTRRIKYNEHPIYKLAILCLLVTTSIFGPSFPIERIYRILEFKSIFLLQLFF